MSCETSRREAEVSLLDGAGATFYTQKKKMSTVEESPVSESESNDVLMPEEGGHSNLWNFFGFKPHDGAQGIIICEQCFGIITQQGNTPNL